MNLAPKASLVVPRWRLLGALLAAGLIFVGQLPAQPPHPTVLMAKVEGKILQVVKAAGPLSVPIVREADGKESIQPDAPLFAERANTYGPGFVTLTGVSFRDDRTGVGTRSGTPSIFFGEFNAVVTPTIDLQGGFLALVLYDRDKTDSSTTDLPSRILLQPLPDLVRNSPIQLSSKIPFRAFEGNYELFVLTFAAGGVEIRNNHGAMAAKYFTRVEKQRLAIHLKDYLAKSGGLDRAASPALTFQPILPELVSFPAGGTNATVTVSQNGWVTDVQLPDELEEKLSNCLRETLSGWLFLPRLKAGQPASSRVQIPLKF